jgi:hypothetical protein
VLESSRQGCLRQSSCDMSGESNTGSERIALVFLANVLWGVLKVEERHSKMCIFYRRGEEGSWRGW